MNIELRRYGIVIKSTEITGDKASIGSGADCNIMIEDPYLAAHVGDLVKRGETWHIVDAGTSLDGIKRDGERIDDEAMVAGAVYSIGGFEVVAQLPAGAAPRADTTPKTAEQVIPSTVLEAPIPRRPSAAIPATVMEPLPLMQRRAEEIPSTVFDAPMPSRRGPAAPAPPLVVPTPTPAAVPVARPSSSRRILLLSVFAMGLVLLLALLVMKKDKKKNIATQAAPATTTVAVATAPPPPPAAKPATPTEMLASLNYEPALKAWEAQLATADDPQIRARYAALALEIGRIHAANRSPEATAYLERVVKFGPAGSEAVAEAKRRLGS